MASSMNFPQADILLGQVATYLLEGDEHAAVALLLECQLEIWAGWDEDVERARADIRLRAPRKVTMALEETSAGHFILSALTDVCASHGYWMHQYEVVARVNPITSEWRSEVQAVITGKTIDNQGILVQMDSTNPVRFWNNLRFRSATEVKIAEALEGRGVMFFPNCKARLTTPAGRRNKEPDFLVCYEGRWGILEVDGEAFHPASRTTEDHARDRLFKEHGVRLVEHFDATECFNAPETVVERFLDLLAKS